MGTELSSCNFSDLTYFIHPIARRMYDMCSSEDDHDLAIRLNKAVIHLNEACKTINPNFAGLPVRNEADLPIRKKVMLRQTVNSLINTINATIANGYDTDTQNLLVKAKLNLEQVNLPTK